ncbi:hypothetical protein VNI00_004423 [Paramarasmius palmivorus]|uniref:FAD-binding domain-containing protein n=1 Tax=Paramarasmius palmivorus TaxID=297713 RepID=A0AAW0DJE1_9AGAR
MQSNNHSNVLIVGAGPSGLVLALTLLRNGVSVRLIDKALSHMIGQRGAGITPRTLEHYKILGILPQIEEEATPVPKIQLRPSPEVDGEEPPARLVAETMEEKPEYYRVRVSYAVFLIQTLIQSKINSVIFGQEDHLAVLREVLSKEYNCAVELSTELASFEPHHDHVVAHIRNVSTGVEENSRFDWLVGTDGAHSIVRKNLGLTFLGETVEENTMVIGDIEVLGGSELEHWTVWGSFADKMLAIRPYERKGKKNHWLAFGGKNVDVVKAASDRDALLNLIFETIGKKKFEYGELRAAAPWRYVLNLKRSRFWKLNLPSRANIRMVDKFGEGRVFVAGDAAHVHSPTGGQGMNSGVQDSVNLGWKLALVHKGLAPTSLLDSYTTERLPVIASMLNKTTDLMHKTFDTAIANNEAWVRGWELRQFGVNYRGSPIIVDERYTDTSEPVDPYRSGHDGSAHAGDRASDAPGLVWNEKEKRLFDLFSPSRHMVLVFSNEEGATKLLDSFVCPEGSVTSAVIYPQGTKSPKESDANHTLVDRDGHAYKHYKVKEGEAWIVIIRPDGYIGAVAKDASGVKKYFAQILL